MARLAIRSDAVVLKNGKLLADGANLIGNWIREGEDAEEVCRKTATKIGMDIELIKPLHPMVRWGTNEKGEKCAIVNLSYLAKLKEEGNGR